MLELQYGVKFMKKIKEFYKKYEEIINYIFFGGLTTVVSLSVKWILLFTFLDAKNELQLQIAIIISWILAVTFAYVTNRKFVFKSKSENLLKEVASFFGSRILTLVMEMLIMWFFVSFLQLNSEFWVFVWTLLTQVLIVIGNYILSKIFVFKNGK